MGPGRAGGADPARVEGPFSGPPPSTAPPVLSNPAHRQQRRPGSPEELLAAPAGADQRPGTPGAAPPVLTSPAQQPVPPMPPMLGQPGRSAPAGRPGKARRPGSPGPSGAPGTGWADPPAARPDVSTPVLHKPAVPLSGSAVSELAEVRLRGRPGQRVAGARPDGTVAPEVTARRTSREPAGAGAQPAEEPQIVTDEQAFTVETPGGGVLTKQPKDASYRAEPPAALGGQ